MSFAVVQSNLQSMRTLFYNIYNYAWFYTQESTVKSKKF